MIVEVLVQNTEEAIEAERFGADRLELVSGAGEGGVTPSHGIIKQVLKSVSIPVQVMIRPNGYYYSHKHCYSETEIREILEDIKNLVDLGGNRIVVGAVNEDNTINEKLLQDIIDISPSIDITFHRAFDEAAEATTQYDAYKVLSKYKKNVKRILSSGGGEVYEENKVKLKQLMDISKEIMGPKIMPGSKGLMSPENILDVHLAVSASNYHFGSTIRVNNSFEKGLDAKQISRIKRVLEK